MLKNHLREVGELLRRTSIKQRLSFMCKKVARRGNAKGILALYKGFSRKIQRKSDHRIFFIFKILMGHYHNFRAGGWIVEILRIFWHPYCYILLFDIYDICHHHYMTYFWHIRHMINDVWQKYHMSIWMSKVPLGPL